MNGLQIILSDRKTGIIFTIISIIAINSWQLSMQNFGWDNSFSLAAAKNISEGHGYSISMASPSDFSRSYDEPLNKWPPGYSWLLILIKRLSGTGWIRSAFLLNGFILSLFVLLFRKMLFQMEWPAWIVHIAVLGFGFIPHGFEAIHYADIIATFLFMLGCSLMIKYTKQQTASGIWILLAALCFTYCACLKYLYVILAIVPLILLFGYGYTRRENKTMYWAASGSAIYLFFIGFLLIYLRNHTGSALFVHPAESGFFPRQLLEAAPLVPASFINIPFYNLQISGFTSIPVATIDGFWRIFNTVCFLWLLYITLKLYKKGDMSRKNYKSFYLILAVGYSAALYIFLGFLTVRLSRHYSDMEWVYLQEPRYFAPLIFIVQQLTVFLFLATRRFFGKSGATLFRVLIVLLMMEEVFHGTYFFIKKIVVKNEYGNQILQDQPYWKAIQLTKQELSKSKSVIVCSNSLIFTNTCSLYGSYSLNDLHLLREKMPATEPFSIITIINREELPIIQDFISKTNTKLEFRNGKLLYFITNCPFSSDVENFPDHSRIQ
jgi:hypothetical protein